MATRTISDAGGNSNTVGAWAEGAVPTSADDIVATATSGNLTLNASLACRSIDLTGYTGTLTHNTGITWSIGDATDPPGNNALVFPAAGWVYAPTGTANISFVSTSTTQLNVDSGGVILNRVQFSGAGGSWRLTNNLVTPTTFLITNGTFDANGYDVTCLTLTISGSSSKHIVFGAGTWSVTSNGTNIVVISGTNLTITRGNPIRLTYSGSTGTRGVSSTSVTEANAFDIAVVDGTDTFVSGTVLNSLTFDGFVGTFSNASRTLYGNFAVTSNSSGMTLSAGTSATTFGATSGTKTLTTSGKTLDFPITINGVGGTFQLGDNLTLGATRALTVTNGAFDTNDHDVDVGSFSSSNSNTRSILMGSGTWTLRNSSTAWTTATTTGLTFDAEQSTLTLTTGSQTIAGGGLTFHAIDLGTSGTKTIQGSNTFHTLTRTVTSAATVTFTDGTTQTVTNSLTLTGAPGQLLTLQGSGAAGWTLAVPATQSISYVSVSRSTATGNTAAAGSTSTDGGNNVNWTFGASGPTAGQRTMLLGVG